MDRDFLPRTLDVFELARRGDTIETTAAIADLPRLRESLLDAEGEVALRLTGASGRDDQGRPALWLDLDARFEAPLQCVRCLEPVRLPVHVDRRFRLERTREAVDADPLDEDAWDALLGSAHFDWREFLEDEALLALPFVPAHARCELPAALPEAQADAASERPNPFAGLAALRRKPD